MLKKILTAENCALAASVILCAVTSFFLFANYMVKSRMRGIPVIEPGTQFVQFKPYLTDVRELGYLTNKDMSEEKNDGFFLQAQYMLAPTVLRLNDTEHKMLILDYSKPVYAWFTMKSMRAAPKFSSEYGPVLAEQTE
ncbi:MAG: hypothetical protein KC897_13435 [Candidatus Omnitrophica bacterium]|nr:hypothetical protein [Candidatus Omnitrophota bacterium]MCB9719417.1 hypothetical protein [Candidatus Omnitrophota bacterium]